jgi:phosphoglycolate phosphatase
MNDLSKIKAIIFDFDDTLVQTKVIRYKAIKHAGKKFYNLEITDEDIDAQWGKPFNEFLFLVFKQVADVETLFSNYKSILSSYPNEAYPGTDSVLEQLHNKYELGIISASNKELIWSGMRDVGFNPEMFRFIQSADDTSVHKPNPEVFNPTILEFNKDAINKPEILYVGDTLDDFNAAVNAGLQFCGIANRTTPEAEFRRVNSKYITDITQLSDTISQSLFIRKQEIISER